MFYNLFSMDVLTIGPTILKSMDMNVTSSINELTKIKSTANGIVELINKYETIRNKIKKMLETISTFTPTTFPKEIDTINTEITSLDNQKDKYLEPFIKPKEISVKSILSDTLSEIKTHIILITSVLGLIFGCIVASHWIITADMKISQNSLYFLFYAIFGALLFPIPIFYGVVYPPMWRAALIPLFKREETSPAWIDYPVFNLFTYSPPDPDDLPTGKMVLRMMCIVISGLIISSLYFKISDVKLGQ